MLLKIATVAIVCSINLSNSAFGAGLAEVLSANVRAGHPDNQISAGLALAKIAEGSDVSLELRDSKMTPTTNRRGSMSPTARFQFRDF